MNKQINIAWYRESGSDALLPVWAPSRGRELSNEQPASSSQRQAGSSYSTVCQRAEVNMADVSERTLQVAVAVSFAAGFLAGWQANRMRRKFLDWRKKRLQDKLSETQKKIDLSWGAPPHPLQHLCVTPETRECESVLAASWVKSVQK